MSTLSSHCRIVGRVFSIFFHAVDLQRSDAGPADAAEV
jgi:hypothetical protein